MIFTISKDNIVAQLIRQLESFFILHRDEKELLGRLMDDVMGRCAYCFGKNENKYFKHEGETCFNPYISAQYVIFLYYFSNSVYRTLSGTEKKQNTGNLADKIYYLNKAMNGCDLFYAIELPSYFRVEHPVGSVMGRAQYGEGFSFLQGCTVGGYTPISKIPVYPTIGENVAMYANSTIIGNCTIGNNVNIGAGALVKNEDIPSDTNVFGQSPNLIIKSRKNV